jgi:hypothetical protein
VCVFVSPLSLSLSLSVSVCIFCSSVLYVQRLVGAHGVTSRRTAIFEMLTINIFVILHGSYVCMIVRIMVKIYGTSISSN